MDGLTCGHEVDDVMLARRICSADYMFNHRSLALPNTPPSSPSPSIDAASSAPCLDKGTIPNTHIFPRVEKQRVVLEAVG